MQNSNKSGNSSVCDSIVTDESITEEAQTQEFCTSVPHKNDNHSHNSIINDEFVISEYIQYLTPNEKEKNKYICPCCNGKNLSINGLKYQCFNGCDTGDIAKTLWDKFGDKDKFKSNTPYSKKVGKPSPKPIPLPENITLNNLATIDTTSSILFPSPEISEGKYQVNNGVYCKETRYYYSTDKTQWISRYDLPESPSQKDTKTFLYYHVKDGKVASGSGDRDWLPYGLLQIQSLGQSFRDRYLLAIEGQSCVDFALKLGIAAIDYKMINTKSIDLIKANFKGIILLPDNDETGKMESERVGKLCQKAQIPFVSIGLPNLPKGGDIIDWKQTEGENISNQDIQNKLLAVMNKQLSELYLAATPRAKADKPFVDVIGNIDKLVTEKLPESELILALSNLSKFTGIHSIDLRKIYNAKLQESDSRADLEDVKDNLDKRLKIAGKSLDISEFVPEHLAKAIKKKAHYFNCKPELLLQLLLTGISSVDHPQTRIFPSFLDRSWQEVPSIYFGMIAPSSQGKSPILKEMILSGMNKIGDSLRENYENKLAQYEYEIQRYETLKSDKKLREQLLEEFPKGEPVKPSRDICYFNNATGESIPAQMERQPNLGLNYIKDELAGIFKNFDKYTGKGSDEEDLLEYYNGSGATVLRRAGLTIEVKDILLSLVGGIQPKVIETLLKGGDSNGKWARFDFINQPATAMHFSVDNSIDITPLINSLYERAYQQCQKREIKFTYDATNYFYKVCNHIEQLRVNNPNELMQQVLGKVRGKIARYAYLLKKLECLAVDGDLSKASELSEQDIDRAVHWVKYLTDQISLMFDSDAELPKALQKILELPEITVRTVYKKLDVKKAVAMEHLDTLVKMGKLELSEGKYIKSQGLSEFVGIVGSCRKSPNTLKTLTDKEDSSIVGIVGKKIDFPESENPNISSFQSKENLEEKLIGIYPDSSENPTTILEPLPSDNFSCREISNTVPTIPDTIDMPDNSDNSDSSDWQQFQEGDELKLQKGDLIKNSREAVMEVKKLMGNSIDGIWLNTNSSGLCQILEIKQWKRSSDRM